MSDHINLNPYESLTLSEIEMMSIDAESFKKHIVKAFGLPDSMLASLKKEAHVSGWYVSPEEVGHDPLDERAEMLLAFIKKLGLVYLESVNFMVAPGAGVLHHSFPASILKIDLATSDDIFQLLARVYQEGFVLEMYNIEQTPWHDPRLTITFKDVHPHIIPS